MTANRHTRQTIVQLLSNMSDGKEIRSYLQRFSEVDQSRFAVIKIGGAIIEDQLEETAAALAFLHTVGLTPIVLHGAGPQLDQALDEAGVKTPKIDGLRVTSAAALDIARGVFTRANTRLVEAVRGQGVAAHAVGSGVIDADILDKEKYGFVGEPSGVRLDLIESAIASGGMPVLTCLGVASGGQLVNVNADAATRALVHALQPMKIIFLTGVGGLLGEDGAIIDAINLASDYDKLMRQPYVHSGMQLKLREIKRLLDDAPLTSSVSITSPNGLIRELFTHGGAGTLIRKGETIRSQARKEAFDGARAAALVEEGFAKKLKPGWWDGLRLHIAHMSENYRAGAVLTKVDDFIYLDKFSVVENARGEGLAHTVWRLMCAETPAFFWRSRTSNEFNTFYHRAADGSVRRGAWTIFWCGQHDFAQIASNVEKIAALPDSFEECS